MFKRSKKYYVYLLICLGILVIGTLEPFIVNVQAQEVTDREIDGNRLTETVDSEAEASVEMEGDVDATDLESETKVQDIETETEAFLEEQDNEANDLANSWRYTDGVWTPSEASERAKRSAGFIPWTKVNGQFINSRGEIIKGALAKGIDISEWQGVIDWGKVKTSDVEFAIIRCGYGSNIFKDGQYKQDDLYWKTNADACTKQGIPFGTYLYSYADTIDKAKSEAQHVLRLVKGYNLAYPIYYDMEDNSVITSLQKEGLTDAQIKTRLAQIAQTFCATVEAAGYEVHIYANKNWFTTYLTNTVFNQWDKWVAQYNYQCDYAGSYSMWQSTSKGSVSGIDGDVDLNFLFKYPESYVDTGQVKAFVTRLYQKVLNRNPDTSGLNSWVSALTSKKNTAADTVYGFAMSKESLSKYKTNEAFVTMLYNAVLDRGPDPSGLNSWLEILSHNVSYKYVLRGFIHSDEFTKMCNSYGITKGNITLTEARDKNINVTKFVNRFYNVFLGRSPDMSGLNNWAGQLINKNNTAASVAYGFVFSSEFKSKNYSNEEYVTFLYNGLFGRGPDPSGKNNWVNKLNSGISRSAVFNGFANSLEFKDMVKKMGIN